jgi:hypothetical protein
MRRIDKVKLHNRILSIATNLPFEDLMCKMDLKVCNYHSEETGWGYVFTANNISPSIYRRLGYRIRKEEVKHALKPIKIEKGLYFVKEKEGI